MSNLKSNVKDLLEGWNTIPNWLSFIRIALIPVFMVLFSERLCASCCNNYGISSAYRPF